MSESRKPGTVQHDKRGNAVWQWAVDTGKHALDSTSALLRRLDLPGLSIEGEKEVVSVPTTGGYSRPAREQGAPAVHAAPDDAMEVPLIALAHGRA